jgi:hypothetical protein
MAQFDISGIAMVFLNAFLGLLPRIAVLAGAVILLRGFFEE